MIPVSEKLFERYQMRKTKAQKTAFIEFLSSAYPQMRVEEGGFPKSRNLVFGDMNKADIVVAAHYDTCAALPFPNFITPKNFLVYLCYSLLIFAPFLIILLLSEMLLDFVFNDFFLSYTISVAILFMLMFVVFIGGKPNKNTANDNTSGVITILELMAVLSDEEKTKYAFVLFDNEENGLLGSAYFSKKHRTEMKNKLLVNLDCVGEGDNIMFVYNSRSMKTYSDAFKEVFVSSGEKCFLHEKALTTFYPSDQLNFKNAIAVAALKKKPVIGYYLDKIHTSEDTVCDMKNVYLLEDGLKRLCNKMSN